MTCRQLVIVLLCFFAVGHAAAEELIELLGPDHQIIYVNPQNITSIRRPRSIAKEHFAKGTNCIIAMVNGNVIPLSESCDSVRHKITGDHQKP